MLTMNYKGLKERYGRPKHKGKSQKYFSYWEYLESPETFKAVSKPSKHRKGTSTKVEYKKQLREDKWMKKRKRILRRDNFKCVLCGSDYNLQVHHTVYKEGKMAWEYSNLSLVTLCDDCHKKVHGDPTHKLYPKYEK